MASKHDFISGLSFSYFHSAYEKKIKKNNYTIEIQRLDNSYKMMNGFFDN